MPLDINLFREEKGGNPEQLRECQRKRFADVGLVDAVIDLDKRWRKAMLDFEMIRKQINTASRECGKKAKAGEDISALKEEVKQAKENLKKKEQEKIDLENQRDGLLKRIGNLVHSSVPVSEDEEKNGIVRTFGECKPKHEKLLHHHELLHMIGGYDAARGVVVAGHRGYFLTGPGVLLNQALINYGLTFLAKRGYMPIQPPYFMLKEVMAETAQLEQFDEELYKVVGDGEDKYLIATSEQPISAFHRREWLAKADLPKMYAGSSTCFRKEAGSHGKDTWGIFRIHQFEKVEQFVVCEPEKSWEWHDKMIETAEEFYKSLGFAYRVVNIVSGELNNAAAKKLDLEAWFPTLGVFRELVSCSNCTDYQSRAMGTRFSQPKGEGDKAFCHMLNATLCATERTICCLLENNQTEEGIVVPEVLRPYMGGTALLPFVKERPINFAKRRSNKNKKKKAEKAKK